VRLFFLLRFLYRIGVGLDNSYQQMVTVHAARSDPPMPRAQAAARAARRQEQERAARTKEKKLRRRERLEQYDEEYQLRKQQGLSPPLVPVNSSSKEDEEEESDRGRAAPERWDPPPSSPRAAEAAMELVFAAGAEALTVGSSVEAPTGATEAPPSPRGRGSEVLQLEVSNTSPLRP
jgi:hypothetical protein